MRRVQLIDLAIGVAILALGVLEALARDHTGRWLAAAVVNGAAVAFRRRSPLLALTAIVLGQVMAHDATYDTDPLSPFLAELLLLFTVGYQLELRTAAIGLGIGVAYVWLDFASGREMELAQAGAQCGFYVLAWTLGRLLHGHETRRAEAEQHAQTAVADERARIARELHDAVAHSVSVMVLQAGAVRRLLGDDPAREREREALAGVEETGRQAVVELHRMLGILRKRDDGAELAPQPSLARVEALVEQVREAGLNATLNIEGDPATLAPGLDMSAYRIVQEALTNALRYAPGARVDVRVRYGRDLQLEVRDDGPGHAPSAGSGHGIVGMRERAALFGGELEAGPLPGGAGFRVHARLPA
ncbi:sensor histidine kinase [Solirubrobacter sp. CPCC 204708]|uniref:histidine kinase n=1 Tax=Solirubrobacter deserti TaxID=2282478 RepID=A0ABT4RFW3_9ACTN|nr:histidine kinase [Solirubrobacter deserti]MBE2318151.1 sensor histidine kinase [Solirubrobacter deserti]MDA0137430.1 histidine kinase [Solirubrobacter deserti]